MSKRKRVEEPDLAQKIVESAQIRGDDEYLLSKPLVVGVSGGPDSLALLHLLCALRGERAAQSLHVAHLDHGFRGEEGAEDARCVAEFASRWVLPHTIQRFDVPTFARQRRLSAEDAARKARYAFLAALARQHSATVAVAHTADDQAETVLLNILRGTGIGGLAGMRPLSTLPVAANDEVLVAFAGPQLPDEVTVYRPLLATWRSEVEAYCRAHDLKPRTDATNLETVYRRNKIRNELIPFLERDYSPGLRSHLVNLAELARSEEEAIEEIVQREAAQLFKPLPDGQVVRLNQEQFASLPLAVRRRLIRRAIKSVAGTLEGITFKQVTEASEVAAGEPGSPNAMDLPHGLIVVRHDGWAEVRRKGTSPTELAKEAEHRPIMPLGGRLPVTVDGTIHLGDGWSLTSRLIRPGDDLPPPGELVAHFDWDKLEPASDLILRTRMPGDKIRPLGLGHYKSLQDLFVDAKIARYVRDRIPLLCSPEGVVLWVPGPGGRRSDIAPVTATTRRILYLEFTLTSEAERDEHAKS